MRKVLIITYYWPPAGGPGVQRWLKFVTYFRDFGIEPIVYIPDNPTYPLTDDSLTAQIPEGIAIIKHKIFEPYGFASIFSKEKTKTISSGIIPTKKQSKVERLLLWVRGNLFIPDARKFWVKPSVKFLSNYIKNEGIDTIITTGPPHSLHLIGMQLKKQSGIRWLADFRDPWTTIGYHSQLKLSKGAQKKHKELEKEVLCSADCVIVTSFSTRKEFARITTKPIEVITNGFDTDIAENTTLTEKFTMAHIGSLLSGRNPVVLWEVLAELVKDNSDFKRDLEIVLAGKVSDEVIDTITAFHLKDHLTLPGYVSHKQAVALQNSSQLLLLIEIDSPVTQAIIPGKLFEYMAAKRPILALGPKNWDASVIINETNTGATFLYQEKEILKEQLLSWYHGYKQKDLQINSENLNKYTRKALTQKMAGII